MLEALTVSAALVLSGRTTMQPEEGWRPAQVVDNRWQDSGDPRVWSGVPTWIRDLGLCVRRHESLHSGHYRAENGGRWGGSTAAGAYQYLDGTWQGVARWVRVGGHYVARQYRHASDAPPWVQDAAFIHTIRHGGIHAWAGTWCPGT